MRALPSTVLSLAFGILLLACSGSANKPNTGPKAAQGDSKADPSASTATDPKGAVGFAERVDKACMLHLQAGAYFSCLSGSDGQCFHYGTTCTPKSSCMFDASTGQHKLCAEAQNGACLRFAASCEPETGCMFSRADNRYRQCSKVKDGSCQSFGPACQPAS